MWSENRLLDNNRWSDPRQIEFSGKKMLETETAIIGSGRDVEYTKAVSEINSTFD
jgi:hypothetical protein